MVVIPLQFIPFVIIIKLRVKLLLYNFFFFLKKKKKLIRTLMVTLSKKVDKLF